MKPSAAEYNRLAKQFAYVPLSLKIMSDTLTPVKVYQAIRHLSPYSYLLETVQQNEKLGRYSWIGIEPIMIFQSSGENITVTANGSQKQYKGNPLDELFNEMETFKPALIDDLLPYQGSVVGYFGYDNIRHFEDIPDKNPDPLDIPESLFILPKTVCVFDHLFQTCTIITLLKSDDADAYKKGESFIHELLDAISKHQVEANLLLEETPEDDGFKVESNMTKEEYIQAVEKAKHYIVEGDIFQVVLSQRLSTPFEEDAFELYRSLRRINPSPYLFYLNYPDFQIAGSSPEILVKRSEDTLTLRPIAGTRKRGNDQAKNKAMEKELLEDPKELAEHMMLVDLGRNDLGRISKFGTVRPTQFKYIENYSHVMHIVTNLESQLEPGKTNSDLIKATFPAGTLTGAPKVRAMEIIDELEKEKRAFYGGAVANIDYGGNFDSCIGIRSVLVKNKTAYVQAGAGIVADSIPEYEYKESINKATAVIKAIQLARRNQK